MEARKNAAAKEEATISLLDIISVIVKRWKFIFFFTAILSAILLTFLFATKYAPEGSWFDRFPDYYTPEIYIRLEESSGNNSLQSMLRSNPMISLATGPTATNPDVALSDFLLTGPTILDQLIKEMGIIKRYKLENTKNLKSSAREILKANLKTSYDLTNNILTISFSNRDPVFATKLLNRAVELLEARFKRFTMENLTQKKILLENRLNKIDAEITKAEKAVLDFKRKYNIIDIDIQLKQQIQQLIALNSDIVQKEMEIKELLQYRRSDDPYILRLQKEIENDKRLVEMINKGFQGSKTENIPHDQIAKVYSEYKDLEKNLRVQTELQAMIQSQYEAVKMDEIDNSKTFQIIEKAEILENKSGPPRGKIFVISGFAFLFLAIFISFILEYVDKVKSDPAESQKLADIKANLPFGKTKKKK